MSRRRRNTAPKAEGPAAESAALPAGKFPAWFWPGLIGIYALALLINAAILSQGVKGNPFARSPCGDADVYWTWAQEIAAGKIIGTTPFFSAPLYPYFLGIIRKLGGGLTAVYGAQLFIHLLTLLLIGHIAAFRFGPGAGLAAALLFVLLTEPAFYLGRVLSCCIQVLFICVLWAAMLAAQHRPSSKRWGLVGFAAGLNCLATPTMLAVIPILAIWIYLQGPRGRQGLLHAALAVGAAVVAISPATIHNYTASGEFIPVSSQAGLTFYHGNNPGSKGTYSPVAGVTAGRNLQNLDAAVVYKQATGHAGTWRQVDAYFIRQGLAFWWSSPARGVALVFRKAYWFLTGRNYDDVYMPALEIETGLASRLALAPLPLPWLIPLSLAALGVLARRPNRYAPELLLFLVPFLTVVVFWFSPRYRFPAVPVIVVLAAWTLQQAVEWRTRSRWTAAAAIAVVVAVALTTANRAAGFDGVAPYRPEFQRQLGLLCDRLGDLGAAIAHHQEALKLKPDFAEGESSLGDELRRMGKPEESLEHLRRAVQLDPRNAMFLNSLGIALAERGSNDEAMSCFSEAVRVAPNVAAYHNSLANILFQKGVIDQAAREYEAALQADPAMPEAHLNLGLLCVRRGEDDAALDHFRQAARFDPQMAEAYNQTALILSKRNETRPAVEALRKAHACAPRNSTYALTLAWYLATGPKEVIDPDAAIAIAGQLNHDTRGSDPRVLDTLAAALAVKGRFEEAAATATKARELAEQQGDAKLAQAILERLKLYEARKPYFDNAGPPTGGTP